MKSAPLLCLDCGMPENDPLALELCELLAALDVVLECAACGCALTPAQVFNRNGPDTGGLTNNPHSLLYGLSSTDTDGTVSEA